MVISTKYWPINYPTWALSQVRIRKFCHDSKHFQKFLTISKKRVGCTKVVSRKERGLIINKDPADNNIKYYHIYYITKSLIIVLTILLTKNDPPPQVNREVSTVRFKCALMFIFKRKGDVSTRKSMKDEETIYVTKFRLYTLEA